MDKKSQRMPRNIPKTPEVHSQAETPEESEKPGFWENLKQLGGEIASAWYNPRMSYRWHQQNARRRKQWGGPYRRQLNWLQRTFSPYRRRYF